MAEHYPAPEGVDPTTPNVARMYDYFLGGKDNFAADREAADRMIAAFPHTRVEAQEGRAFLGRAVRFLVESGIRQIVDIGSGLPTQGNVHEIAHRTAPETRVVYVDYDPIVCVHARALMAKSDRVSVVQADVRDPKALLSAVDAHIDFDRPVAFLLFAVLHFVGDQAKPYEVVATLRDASAPGSYLAVSHAFETRSPLNPEALKIYRQATAALSLRSREEILGFFDGYELLQPGLVVPREWRPDADEPLFDANPALPSIGLGGVGRKL
ncbi:SAM-dependent methyltransferase [Streptosporangiaceae bacterium NEAU-GS5]|nr:SAM-dependent methyltransferase [Streptosporangiaceae bacterium NEAU-GS5]